MKNLRKTLLFTVISIGIIFFAITTKSYAVKLEPLEKEYISEITELDPFITDPSSIDEFSENTMLVNAEYTITDGNVKITTQDGILGKLMKQLSQVSAGVSNGELYDKLEEAFNPEGKEDLSIFLGIRIKDLKTEMDNVKSADLYNSGNTLDVIDRHNVHLGFGATGGDAQVYLRLLYKEDDAWYIGNMYPWELEEKRTWKMFTPVRIVCYTNDNQVIARKITFTIDDIETEDDMIELDKNSFDPPISIKGKMDPDALLFVNNIEETDSAYKEMQEIVADRQIIGAYNVTLVGTSGTGKMQLSFAVDEKYNGKNILVVHKKSDGTIEKFLRIVKEGQVMIEVTELSPFMLALELDKAETPETPNTTETPESTETPEAPNTQNSSESKLDETPKTGTNNMIVIVSILSIITLGIIKKVNR